MGCSQHADASVIDPTCDECVLADRAERWVDWFDARIALLDAQSAQLADDLQAVTAARDAVAEALEHGRLDAAQLTSTVSEFVAPGVVAPVRSAATSPVVHPVAGGSTVPAAVRPRLSPAAMLSAAGAALLLVASIVFTAVSWDRLGTGGQITVMGIATVLAAGAAVVCQRRALRWTAEALSWLAAALAVVDVVAASAFDLVLDDAAPEIVVAVSALGVLVVGLAVALATNTTDTVGGAGTTVEGAPPPSFAADIREHVSGHALVAPWVQGPLAVIVAAGALAVRLGELRWAPVTAAVAALVLVATLRVRPGLRRWWAAPAVVALVVSVFVSFGQVDGTAVPLIYASTVALLVVALGLWAYRCRPEPQSVPLGSVASVLVMVVLPALHVARCDTTAQTVIVVASAVAAATGSFATTLERRRMLAVSSWAPLVGAVVAMVDTSATGAVALAATAVASLAWVRHADGRRVSAAVSTSVAIALVGYALAAAGLDLGWSGAVASMVATVVVGGLVQWSTRRADRTGRGVGIDEPALVAVGTCAVLAAVVATAVSTVTTPAFVAAAFVAAAIGVLTTATPTSPVMRWAGLAVAAIATAAGWLALLAHLDVQVVEASSVPVGGVWCIVGVVAMRRESRLRSWPALGPGLAAAALPTVAVLMDGDPGLTRMVVLLVAGAAVAVVGGVVRQQAPLVVGVAAAVFAALTQVGPWAVGLPRWLSLGVVGAALLVAGARFESVRAGAHRATDRFAHYR